MKFIAGIILTFLLSGCYSTLHYSFLPNRSLPAGKYLYYAPLSPVDLKGSKYNIEIRDNRKDFAISCSNLRIDRKSELEGSTGFDFFSAYVRALIVANNGVIDSKSDTIITINLGGLSDKYEGFNYIGVFGLVEFSVSLRDFHKTYCSQMADEDEDAPGSTFDTRKGALRKIVSASTRRALEELMHDIAEAQKAKELQK